MTSAAKSIYYFGIYLYITGITLIFMPNLFLGTLGMPETNEVWIRVVGIVAFVLGFYYHQSGLKNNIDFFKLTIPARIFVLLAFIALVILKLAAPMLVGIGVIDGLGALWTWSALKKP